MAGNESKLYGWVSAAVRDMNGAAWKLQDQFRSGVPDQVICVAGNVAWLEAKWLRSSARPQVLRLTAMQHGHIKQWSAAGGTAGALIAWEPYLYYISGSVLPGPSQRVTHDELMLLSKRATGWTSVIRDDLSKKGCAHIITHVLT